MGTLMPDSPVAIESPARPPAEAPRRFDILVFIGRFQPLHNGHLQTMLNALDLADQVLILVGSSNSSRSIKNPWSFAERQGLIELALAHARGPQVLGRVSVRPLPDVLYNPARWSGQVRDAMEAELAPMGLDSNSARVGIIGHEKDMSSGYLGGFPAWSRVPQAKAHGLDATAIREALFASPAHTGLDALAEFETMVPPAVWASLAATAAGSGLPGALGAEELLRLREEHAAIQAYRASWGRSPYPPVFVTADAVLVHREHVLLIRRKHAPGRGLWALPGGFLDQHERILDCALRELSEETGLTSSGIRPVAAGVFDHPERSLRGRTVTHAHLFAMDASLPLPDVAGGDDAETAAWFALDQFRGMAPEMHEDHWQIVAKMLGWLD